MLYPLIPYIYHNINPGYIQLYIDIITIYKCIYVYIYIYIYIVDISIYNWIELG